VSRDTTFAVQLSPTLMSW